MFHPILRISITSFSLFGSETMAKVVRDRTEDFKDAVHRALVNSGYTESKTAAIMATFIMRKNPERGPFTKAALTTLASIRTLEEFLMKHKKDYVDPRRTTEQERDNIEHEVSFAVIHIFATLFFVGTLLFLMLEIVLDAYYLSPGVAFHFMRVSHKVFVTIFIKTCKERIDVLKNSINEEDANAKGWLSIRSDNSNADTIAHKHGVVLILSEKLHSVTSQFDKLRALRFQEAINRVAPRRKPKAAVPADATENSNSIEPRDGRNLEVREPDEVKTKPVGMQKQLLDDETRTLQVELASMLDAVQVTETKMVEISALNHLISTHVLQQAQQIEYLYEQAIEATKNVELGNKELSQAIRRNGGSRTFLLLFLFVLTFSVLFLDWYN